MWAGQEHYPLLPPPLSETASALPRARRPGSPKGLRQGDWPPPECLHPSVSMEEMIDRKMEFKPS